MKLKTKPTCPYCITGKVYKVKGNQPYKCYPCNRKFTLKTRTIIGGSHIPIEGWLLAIELLKRDISTVSLSKILGVQQKTAHFMVNRLKK